MVYNIVGISISNNQKVSEYDQEVPQSHTADQLGPRHREEEPQNTHSHKTSGRQLTAEQPGHLFLVNIIKKN